jgi:F420-dependent oxidoreductase-like protein
MQPWDDIVSLARHCEQTGWDGVWFADHFMPNKPDGRPSGGPTHEAWSVLAALGAAVPRLRLGPLVSGNTYRHPAVLAKMAATVDHISSGRVVLGLGAGWQVNEHDAYGIELPSVKERLDRLDEACQVVLGLLRQPRTTFAGEHYVLRDAPLAPKPVQPRLPLLIGGGGERRTMRIAARYADEWNTWSDPETMAAKRQVLLSHCDSEARDPSDISISTQALVLMAGRPVSPPPYGRFTIEGSPDQLVATMEAYRAAGVDEFIVPDFNLGTLDEKKATCDLFIDQVAAKAR